MKKHAPPIDRQKQEKEIHPLPMESFKQEQYKANQYLVSIIMGHFFLRYLNRLYHEFEGDLILPMVLGEIAHHNIFKFYSCKRHLDIQDKKRARKKRTQNLEPGNAFSISQATGIPRETIRRKIDKLVENGWILKNSQGKVIIAETVCENFLFEFNKKSICELLEAAEWIKEILEVDGACSL